MFWYYAFQDSYGDLRVLQVKVDAMLIDMHLDLPCKTSLAKAKYMLACSNRHIFVSHVFFFDRFCL